MEVVLAKAVPYLGYDIYVILVLQGMNGQGSDERLSHPLSIRLSGISSMALVLRPLAV